MRSDDLLLEKVSPASKGSWEMRKKVACASIYATICLVLMAALSLAMHSAAAKTGFFENLFKGLAFTSWLDTFFKTSSAYMKSASSRMPAFHAAVKGIAFAIAGTGCLLGIIDNFEIGRASPSILSRYLVQYCITAMMISDCGRLADGLDALGIYIMGKLQGLTADTSSLTVGSWNDMFRAESADHAGIWVIMAGLALYIIIYFNMIIAKIGIYKQCFICLIELAIRMMFLPLGIAWLPLDGVRGRGTAYIKGYVGIYIRIGLMYAVAYFAGIFMSVAAGDGITNITNCLYIVALVAMVPALMGTTDAIAADIIGN